MKTVFITGTTRGIGKVTAIFFAERDYRVIAHARKPSDDFVSFCNAISAIPVYFDMLDYPAMKECVGQLKKDNIIIDVLVNNAGVAHGGTFQMTPISVIKSVFDANLFSHMQLTQLIMKIMSKEDASIVNVASVTGIDIRPGNSAYGVSKAAMIAWTKVLQAELGGRIRVNAVAPGLTETEMAQQMDDNLQTKTLSRAVIGRLAKASEIANAIYFLASNNASFISGQVLKVDGGGGYLD